MIISASRRTDIPKFFSEWLSNRIKEGFVDVRNPLFASQVSRYSLSPDKVDGIVFWTKDPAPMLKRLNEFAAYSYYFQFTLTPYGRDVEGKLSDKRELINTFKELSTRIGSDKIIWRYDPILLNSKYEQDYIIRAFKTIASELKGYTKQVTISFIDEYKFGGMSVYESLNTGEITTMLQNELAGQISEIARENEMIVSTCAEKINLEKYGIEHARCVDGRKFEKLSGCRLSANKKKYKEIPKDSSQRKECMCVDSIDIGCPNTCMNGCKYCYATSNPEKLAMNFKNYNPSGTLLCGVLGGGDKLTDHRNTGDKCDRSYKFTGKVEPKSGQLTLDE